MSTAAAERFRHEALLYEGIDGFMDSIVPFVREGVERREPVLVAVDERKIGLLRGALGDDAGGVRFVEMRRLGKNPGCIIPAWRQFVVDNAGGNRPMRGVGEPVWPGRGDAELDECHRHEALLNTAFDGGPAWTLVCPYDTSALAPEVVEHARCTHPVVDGERSDSYRAAWANPLAGELPKPAGHVEQLDFSADDLSGAREMVMTWARAGGLAGMRAADMVLAFNELAANSIRHGGGGGRVRAWRENGHFVCEVRDGGRLDDPLVGRELPDDDLAGGRGLWLVHQLCDLVQLRSVEPGTVARVRLAL